MIDAALVAAVVFGLCLAAVTYVAAKSDTLAPSLVAYLLRIAVAAAIFSSAGLYAPDAIYYDSTAQGMFEGDASATVTAGKEGWPELLAWVYGVFGHYPQVGLILNAAAGGLTASVVGLAADRIGAPKRTAAWFAALLPSAVLWSSLLLRESITWLLLLGAAVAFIDLGRGHRSKRAIVAVAITLILLLGFRGTLAIIVAGSGFAAVAFMRRATPRWVLVASLALPPLVIFTPVGSQIGRIVGGFSLESINASRSALSRSAETGWPVVQVTDISSLIDSLLIAVPRLLLGPFPWEWLSVSPILALDAVVWLVVLFFGLRGWSRLPARSTTVLVLISSAVLAALITTSGNYGTAQRLRVQSEMLLLPIAAAAMPLSRHGDRRTFSQGGRLPQDQQATRSLG